MGTDGKHDLSNEEIDIAKDPTVEDTDRRIEQLLENLSAQNAVIEKLKENCKLSVKN